MKKAVYLIIIAAFLLITNCVPKEILPYYMRGAQPEEGDPKVKQDNDDQAQDDGDMTQDDGDTEQFSFEDDFEDGDLAEWTIGGRQEGGNSYNVESRNGSLAAHLYHEQFTEITLEKTYDYDPNLRFRFDMEGVPNSDHGPTSTFWASAGVTFYFYDDSDVQVGRVRHEWATSTKFEEAAVSIDEYSHVRLTATGMQSFDYTASDLLSEITPIGDVAQISIRFQAYCTGWPDVEEADLWVDNVVITK